MFEIKHAIFGKLPDVTLRNTKTNESLRLVPAFGANIVALNLAKAEQIYSVIDGAKSETELRKNDWFKSAQLIPFPNRTKAGRYRFGGRSYELPINFPQQGHAIHGLVYNRPFSVIKEKCTKSEALIELRHVYTGQEAGFPFPFTVTLTYRLSAAGFSCATVIKNTGKKKLPLALGWHPYFTFGETVDDLWLQLPFGRRIEVDKAMIPTGKYSDYTTFLNLKRIGRQKFDTGFALTGRKGQVVTSLHSKRQDVTLEVWQETGKSKYNYLQVFIPPERQAIAIEPMTGATNAFNNKKGLVILEPRSSLAASFGVNLA